MATRTGPQPLARPALYRSGRSSRPSLSTDRLITWNRTRTGRTRSTSSSQREVIHAQGQRGSNHISTTVVMSSPGYRDAFPSILAGRGTRDHTRVVTLATTGYQGWRARLGGPGTPTGAEPDVRIEKDIAWLEYAT